MTDMTFKQAYGTLQRHAETLRVQREPNIDDLLTIVTESVAAYHVCKSRIDAVEKALEQALDGAGVDAPRAGSSSAATESQQQVSEPGGSDDDDVPF